MNSIFRGFSPRICIWLLIAFAGAARVSAQSTNDQIAALQLQLTNAWHQVEAIVNQPVPTYKRDDSYQISIYSPGWFHPGAMTPDFNRVDVRKSQEFNYKSQWVSSDVTPTMMFRGSDLEFNAMTKLFYTNRDLPKKRLTEADMLQINSLYRTIGHCQSEIDRLQNPPEADTAATDTQDDTNAAAPPKAIAAIERIPQQTRIRYGGIAIGALLVIIIGIRLIRKGSG
ncbi:MAG TPA: hypothetical protein VH280_21705 [Verrucomicrobiae bacterium]|jgi:hypothetical protein|nr:hypothetical protein [Verrucomicrobiae bacterium]